MPPGTFRAVWTSKADELHCSPPEEIPGAKHRRRVAQKEELTTDNHDVIATLNDLLEISRDGEQGFHTCVEGSPFRREPPQPCVRVMLGLKIG
jgi:hypothetical protein